VSVYESLRGPQIRVGMRRLWQLWGGWEGKEMATLYDASWYNVRYLKDNASLCTQTVGTGLLSTPRTGSS
jgi:hypothetical protein